MSAASCDWPSNASGYKILNPLGSGYFGTVWKAEILTGSRKGDFVAVKQIELEKCADNKLDEIRKSMLLSNLLDHPNILSCRMAFISKQQLWVVSEIMDGGSLTQIIQSYFPNGIKDQTLIATVIKETLKGLGYLHQNHQMHRDIKCAHILISSNGAVKISDFGLATRVKEGQKKNTCIGSPCWMAPEVLDQDGRVGYDYKADIWSLGITALELAYGHPPHSDLNTMQLILKTLNEEPPTLGEEPCWDDSFREFVSHCLVKDASKRKSVDELFKTCKPFFSKAKSSEYIKEKLFRGHNKKLDTSNYESNSQCPTPMTSTSSRRSCSIRFDFGAEDEEMNVVENARDVQVKAECCHLTKDESEFLLRQSLNKSLICTAKFNQSFDAKRPAKEKPLIKKSTLSASSKALLSVEQGTRLVCLKGDCCGDLNLLNEEDS